MRIGMGQASSITLIDGSVIANPATTPPTGNQCLAYQCGADSSNIAALEWCSEWGQAGAFPCTDVQCQPVAQYLNCAPPAAPAAPVQVAPVQLTPQNIVQPLPDITGTLAPPAAPPPSIWCEVNAWIAANPWLAVGILAGGALLLWPKGGR